MGGATVTILGGALAALSPVSAKSRLVALPAPKISAVPLVPGAVQKNVQLTVGSAPPKALGVVWVISALPSGQP